MKGKTHEAPIKLTGLVWWIDRWRQSSAFVQMTMPQQAAYRNLLDEAFLRGGVLPDDDFILGRASGSEIVWPEVREVVLRWFTKTADGWRNDTLDQVIYQSQRRAKNQRNYRRSLGDNKRDNGAITRHSRKR